MYDQDLRSVTVTDQAGVITFTIQQYGAFTMPIVCHCYWPQVHIYLTGGPPSLPDFCTSFSAQLGPYPYPIGLFNGPCQITRPGPGSLVQKLDPVVVDSTTVKYAFPATAIGKPRSFGWRVIQFGSPSPLDWVPDSGTVTHALTPVVVRCVVPNVLGKPLAKAKTRIVRTHCRVGTVTRVASPKKKNTVVSETPRPGKRLKKGAKVNLKVSRGP